MNGNSSLVKLNALKHHYSFLISRMEQWIGSDWNVVCEEMQELGNNQFDIYTGDLKVEEILFEANNFFIRHHEISSTDLQKWIGKHGYKIMELSDQSKWIVRVSESPETLAHLHPAHNQSLVRRIRATHLKTAVALIYENGGISPALLKCTTRQINAIRIARLGLSPVKSIEVSRNILETVKFLIEGYAGQFNF